MLDPHFPLSPYHTPPCDHLLVASEILLVCSLYQSSLTSSKPKPLIFLTWSIKITNSFLTAFIIYFFPHCIAAGVTFQSSEQDMTSLSNLPKLPVYFRYNLFLPLGSSVLLHLGFTKVLTVLDSLLSLLSYSSATWNSYTSYSTFSTRLLGDSELTLIWWEGKRKRKTSLISRGCHPLT